MPPKVESSTTSRSLDRVGLEEPTIDVLLHEVEGRFDDPPQDAVDLVGFALDWKRHFDEAPDVAARGHVQPIRFDGGLDGGMLRGAASAGAFAKL